MLPFKYSYLRLICSAAAPESCSRPLRMNTSFDCATHAMRYSIVSLLVSDAGAVSDVKGEVVEDEPGVTSTLPAVIRSVSAPLTQ